MSDNEFVVAQYQPLPSPLDTAATLAHIEQQAAQASDWGAQLLVLPEMYMTGYNVTPHELNAIAEPSNGALSDAMATICQTHRVAVFYGYAERADGGVMYNASQLIDANGHRMLNYRKAHLWGELDRNLFSAGNTLCPVVELQGWRIGAAICYDLEFPETLRHLAIQGAELVLVPTGLMSPWREVADQVVPVRAYENRLFIAYTNYCGSERELDYVGHSSIVDPNGGVLARAGARPVLLTATLQRSVLIESRETLPYLDERRPELYGTLSGQHS